MPTDPHLSPACDACDGLIMSSHHCLYTLTKRQVPNLQHPAGSRQSQPGNLTQATDWWAFTTDCAAPHIPVHHCSASRYACTQQLLSVHACHSTSTHTLSVPALSPENMYCPNTVRLCTPALWPSPLSAVRIVCTVQSNRDRDRGQQATPPSK